MLDLESLKSAFTDLNIVLDEISRYRQDALPQMAKSILELDQLTSEAEEAIEKHERSDATVAPLWLRVRPLLHPSRQPALCLRCHVSPEQMAVLGLFAAYIERDGLQHNAREFDFEPPDYDSDVVQPLG